MTEPAPERRGVRKALTPGKHLEVVAVAGIFVVLIAIFFREVLFTNGHVIPWDFVSTAYPYYGFFNKWLWRGVIPLWSPHIGFGLPTFADIGSQLFYPYTYLQALAPFSNPLHIKLAEIGEVAHVLLAAIAMYYLCRYIGYGRLGSVSAGIIFVFGGFFPTKVQHPAWIYAVAWFPLQTLYFLKVSADRRTRYYVAFCIVTCLMLLTGFWQAVMYCLYCIFFWAVVLSVRNIRKGICVRRAVIPLLAVCMGAISALAWDVAQFIPSFQLASMSVRHKITFEQSMDGAIKAPNIISLVAPGLFQGKPGDSLLMALGDPSLLYSYTGTITLFLLAYAWFRRTGGPHRVFMWSAAAISFLLAMGSATPLYRLAYVALPGFAFFRRPVALYFFTIFFCAILAGSAVNRLACRDAGRAGVRQMRRAALWALAVAIAGAIAIDSGLQFSRAAGLAPSTLQLLTKIAERAWPAFVASIPYLFVVVVVATLIIRDPRRRPLYAAALVAACFIDLYQFNSNHLFNSIELRADTLATPTKLLDSPLPGNGVLNSHPADPYRTGLASYGGLFDNGGSIVGYENPGGYILFRLKRYIEYMARVDGPDSPLLDLANVRYFLTSPPFMAAPGPNNNASPTTNIIKVPNGPLPADHYRKIDSTVNDWYQLYENRRALPRYYFASAVEVIPDETPRLQRLAGVAGQRIAILETPPPAPVDNCSAIPVTVEQYEPNRIRLKFKSPGNCILVASDTWYPGWKAFRNGQETPIYIADNTFRAIQVRPGDTTVEMRLLPPVLFWGMAVSLFAMALFAVVVVRYGRRLEAWCAIAEPGGAEMSAVAFTKIRTRSTSR